MAAMTASEAWDPNYSSKYINTEAGLVVDTERKCIFVNGDRVGLLVDMDTRTMTMSRNGTPIPALVFEGLPDKVHIAATVGANHDHTCTVRLVQAEEDHTLLAGSTASAGTAARAAASAASRAAAAPPPTNTAAPCVRTGTIIRILRTPVPRRPTQVMMHLTIAEDHHDRLWIIASEAPKMSKEVEIVALPRGRLGEGVLEVGKRVQFQPSINEPVPKRPGPFSKGGVQMEGDDRLAFGTDFLLLDDRHGGIVMDADATGICVSYVTHGEGVKLDLPVAPAPNRAAADAYNALGLEEGKLMTFELIFADPLADNPRALAANLGSPDDDD